MIEPWKKISEESTSVGFRKLLRRVFVLPDGREEEFVVKNEHEAVCVLALTPQNQVLLVKQFRPGPEEVLLELPGGALDPGENIEQAIERELLEETGYSGRMIYLGPQYKCGYSTSVTHSFVALDCRDVSGMKPDQNEFLEVVEMLLREFRNHLRSGKLSDVKTGFLGLDYLNLL